MYKKSKFKHFVFINVEKQYLDYFVNKFKLIKQ